MRSNNRTVIVSTMAIALVALTAQKSLSATLYGGVNHSDFLAPADQVQPTPPPVQQAVPPTVNATVARATLQNPAIDWFPIPKWMAGKWTKKGDTTTSVTDLRTGITTPMNQFIEDYMTVTWGYQKDNQGNVWHANLVPSERDGVSQGKSVSFKIVNMRILEATPENLATRIHYIVKETEGAQLADIFQQESLTHYALVGSINRMDAISSNRVFSYQGAPMRDGKLVSEYSKASEFEPLTSKQGIDLASSLNDYLKSHNMAGLAK